MRSAVTISLVPEAAGGPFVYWNDLEKGVLSARQLGFDAVEIFPPDAATLRQLNVKSLCDASPVAAVGTGAGWVKHRLVLCDNDEEKRTRAIEFVRSIQQIASELGAPTIIGSMQGRSLPTLAKDEARKWLRDSLEKLNEEARRLGQVLLFEPLNRYETDQANTLQEGLVIIDGLDQTKLLADLFHMNIEETSIPQSILAAADRIGHVHFADTNRQAIGFGHLDVAPIIDALNQIRYSGYLSAEVFAKPDSARAAQQTIDAFHGFVK